eukprot:jgi/Phyca11/127755/e_gw1.71.203.1
MSFVTTDTVCTPERVPQGASDSATHFQNEMQSVFAEMLYSRLLVWIDDILVYGKDPAAFIAALRQFFELCRAHRLKLSVSKSCLFQKEIRWCGRVFSGVGTRHDPDRINAFQELPVRATAADLQQFLCAAGWMRDTLVDFARVMRPLHDKLEAILRVSGRTKKLAAGDEEDMFQTAKQLLGSSQLLHFPKDSAIVCLFTDASDLGWGHVVTQQHKLLVCKSGIFDATERRWSCIEKEAYPIIWAARNLGHLLIRSTGFRLFCDHKNLLYVFSPTHEVKRHIRGKLQRWALSLTGLQYRIEHIDGEANVWADLLSR